MLLQLGTVQSIFRKDRKRSLLKKQRIEGLVEKVPYHRKLPKTPITIVIEKGPYRNAPKQHLVKKLVTTPPKVSYRKNNVTKCSSENFPTKVIKWKVTLSLEFVAELFSKIPVL